MAMARKKRNNGERGQVFGGMTAIAVDLGSYATERRDLQNAADAIALAAAQELPNGDAAQEVADEWAEANGIDPATMTVTIIPQGSGEPNPKVEVSIERDHAFIFARLIGVTSAGVGASATAIKTSVAGGDGIVPLSITEEELAELGYGDLGILKYDAQNIEQGNTSPIRIDDPGSGNCTTTDNYCRGVKEGSQNVVCASGADATYCDGPTTAQTETGNKVGPTRTAINHRLEGTDVHCDEFEEVFEDDPTTSDADMYHLVNECNPFLSGGYPSYRVLIIPVINSLCNGSCTVTIVDFALFFLEGYARPNSCTGNTCEVMGRFVRVEQNVGLLAGTFNPEASLIFVRLVQ
jgi:hypothetical protein